MLIPFRARAHSHEKAAHLDKNVVMFEHVCSSPFLRPFWKAFWVTFGPKDGQHGGLWAIILRTFLRHAEQVKIELSLRRQLYPEGLRDQKFN